MYSDIIHFWFEEIDPAKWWVKDKDFDQQIAQRFSVVHAQAIRCELYQWRQQPLGRLAEIIVLDQFSRNIYRDTPSAFAADALALALAQEAVAIGVDLVLSETERGFLYLPFMHSESSLIHDMAMGLYQKNSSQSSLDFEIRHKNIIDRFGRYPHRNAILGRESSAEEIAFLEQPGSAF